jgi:hypothetical protein
MGTSTSPVRLTMPESANTLVPLLLAVPTAAKGVCPHFHQASTHSQRLDVVDDRGHAEKALYCRERRTRSRHTALALDTLHERSFFAAHEGAAPSLSTISRSKPLPKMFLPSRPYSVALGIAAFNAR